MTSTHTYKGIVWLDLVTPSEDEISNIIKRYDLHPLVGEELKSENTLAKISAYDDYMLVVLRLPIRKRTENGFIIEDREVDFVIGKNFLITCRSGGVEQLEYFAKIFEANAILNKDEKIEHGGYLFYYMVKRIYSGMIEDLTNIRDALITTESRIYTGDERKMVEVLSSLSRELIDIKQTVRIHHDVWDDLVAHADKTLFGGKFTAYIRDIRDQFNSIHEHIVNARELLADLRETNDSLLTTKQNETIKVLTLMAFVTFPLSLLVAIFALPSENVPIMGSRFDWITIVIIVIAIAVLMLAYFKKKRWI